MTEPDVPADVVTAEQPSPSLCRALESATGPFSSLEAQLGGAGGGPGHPANTSARSNGLGLSSWP